MSKSYPTISNSPSVQAAYVKMRMQGQSHSIAEMCALRQPPGKNNTEQAFWHGTHEQNGIEGMAPFARNMYLEEARRAGVNIQGKVYKHSLASPAEGCVSDPRAWISDTSEIKQLCQERGMDCDGVVKHKEPIYDPVDLSQVKNRKNLRDGVMQELKKKAAKRPVQVRVGK